MKRNGKDFERAWKTVEKVRKDPESMKLLDKLIARHS